MRQNSSQNNNQDNNLDWIYQEQKKYTLINNIIQPIIISNQSLNLVDDEINLQYKTTDFLPFRIPCYRFNILQNKTNIKVGSISINFGNTAEQYYYYGNIGYSVKDNFRGKGYAKKALKLILQQKIFTCSEITKLDQLYILIDPSNIASQKTALSAGFKFIDIIPIPHTHPLNYQDNETEGLRYIYPLKQKYSNDQKIQNSIKSSNDIKNNEYNQENIQNNNNNRNSINNNSNKNQHNDANRFSYNQKYSLQQQENDNKYVQVLKNNIQQYQKLSTNCKQNHVLEKIKYKYIGNRQLICDNCNYLIDKKNTEDILGRCNICDYDLCYKCKKMAMQQFDKYQKDLKELQNEINIKFRNQELKQSKILIKKPILSCLKGHELEYIDKSIIYQQQMQLICDECDKDIRQSTYKCIKCDYDRCEQCCHQLLSELEN